MTKYKLLAVDLDGTMLPNEGMISDRAKAAVRRAQGAGIVVTAATGRTFPSTLVFAEQLGVTSAPLICYQGALIKNPTTGEVLYEERLSSEVMRDVVLYSRRRNLHLNVYTDDQTYMERFESAGRLYNRISRHMHTPVPDLLEILDRRPTKCIFVCETKEATEALLPELKTEFAGRMRVVRSHDLLIEGGPPDATKGTALARLANHLGIARAETAAIGDNDNDAEMIAWAGLGLAMGNSTPDVLAVARVVLPSVWEDGAAYGIEQYLLNGTAADA
jgi:Cof subfamily protein (haloacid dehalogenase superfamily)